VFPSQTLTDGTIFEAERPADFPAPHEVKSYAEPMVLASIIIPQDRISALLSLMQERRGVQMDMVYLDDTRVLLKYEMPWAEVVTDFFDVLKSVSAGASTRLLCGNACWVGCWECHRVPVAHVCTGYASFDYELIGYEESDLVKVSILVNAEPVDALAFIAHRSHAESRGRQVCEKLKDLIPRQLFKIAVQAAIGGKVIARETVSAMRKDVTAKCYGGDITRKKKLLEKQKKGKKRMRQIGNVEIPQSAFLAALKTGSD